MATLNDTLNKKKPLATVPDVDPIDLESSDTQTSSTEPTPQNQTPLDPGTKSLASALQQKPEYLEGYRQLANDPDYQQRVPSDTRLSLQNAIDKAEQLYTQRTDKNDWLEVAQVLGRAAAQYGAARAGQRTGHDMSNLGFDKGIDYGQRNEQAFRDYQQQLKNAGTLEDQEKDARREVSTGLSEQLRAQRDAETQKRQDANAARAENRDALAQKRFESTQTEQQKRSELQDINQQQGELAKKLQARESLVNQMQQEGDLSDKSVKKLQEKYGTLAAQGGVDLDQLNTELNSAKKQDSFLGFKYNTADEDKKKQILQSKTDEVKNLIEGLKAHKQQLLQNKSPSLTNQPNVDAQRTAPVIAQPNVQNSLPKQDNQASTKQDAKIAQYADLHKLTYEQARKVLTDRGYKPQE